MKLLGIAAMGKSRQIGINNKLPWKNRDELNHFRETTKDSILIMGRKTWESIPKKYWQWHGRRVIVISKTLKGGGNNVFYVDNPSDAVVLAKFARKDFQNIFVCGGESIYNFFLPHIDRLIITEMDYDECADSYFPEFDKLFEENSMKLVKSSHGDFKVKTYEKIR